MEEIFAICKRVTVLRDGRFIHSGLVSEVSEKDLIRMMVDREVNELFPKQENAIGEVLLAVKGLSVDGEFEDINFELHRGAILSVAELMDAGRTELMEAIVGARQLTRGEIYLREKKS
jgi:ABC-type sugar transport system ATPase subunit